MIDLAKTYWANDASSLLTELKSRPSGLTSQEAAALLSTFGPNILNDEKNVGPLRLLLRQYESPLLLVLIFGAVLSLVLRQWTDAGIIIFIVVASSFLGFYQEYKASTALAALRLRLALTTKVLRDGTAVTVPAASLVRGDVIQLSAGNLVPADGIILNATDFLVSEGSLTGESMPVEKKPGTIAADAAISQRTNSVFSGTSVRSGVANILIVATGSQTALGTLPNRLAGQNPKPNLLAVCGSLDIC